MANSAFTPAVLTVSGSSSTSSGEKNYVTATDGNASGLWVASGVTVATSTSTIPDNITKASSLAITWTSGTTGYARYRFTLDQADYAKKFKIQWDQVYGTAGHWTLQVYSNTASDYTGTSTALTVQTSAVPGITGTFTTSVDMPGSTAPYIEIRIVASSTSATTIYLNSILMGPGTITQGAAISEWQSFTPTFNNLGAGSMTITTASYRRVGSNLEIEYRGIKSTSGSGTSSVQMVLPLNLTIASSGASCVVGSGWWYSGSAYNDLNTTAGAAGGTTISFAKSGAGDLTGSNLLNGDTISFDASIPVAEWSGSGTVSLGAGAQVEYVSHDGTNIVRGPSGSLIPTTTPSSTIERLDITTGFQYSIQTDDILAMEIQVGGVGPWFPIPATVDLEILQFDGTNYVGLCLETLSSSIYMSRGKYRRLAGATSQLWSGLTANSRWRVRKAKASSPVGFGLAGTDGSAGLVNPYSVGSGVVYAGTYTPTITSTAGFTIGTIYAASYLRVGSVVTVSGSFKLATSATTNNVATISLPINRTTASVLTNGGGTAVYARGSVTPLAIPIYTNGSTSSLEMFAYTGSALASDTTSYTFTYSLA